jgi:endonuclease-3
MPKAKSKTALQEQAKQVCAALRRTYPRAECALIHDSAFQLLAATILSAQCTDERVNRVTPHLFRAFPTPAALARASQAEVEGIIQSCGFFRSKATNLRGMAERLQDKYGGEVPQSLDELVTLPGVGRKTANVVLGTCFGIASGVVVDTHVQRITRLLGLTRAKTAEAIEQELMQLLPQREWVNFSHRLIHHGRKICIARRPRCLECPLLKHCDRAGLPPIVNKSGT